MNRIKHVFVAKSKSAGDSSNIIFSKGKHVDANRQSLETKIKQRCGPLTLFQRCGDWFVSKCNRISGTMAKIIVGSSLNFDDDETKADLLLKCCKSWYACHKSSNAMKKGSMNELPISHWLKKLECMKCFYECGIIEITAHPYVAVSADVFSLIVLKNG